MKVYSPNKDYTGVSASVPFCNGAGETDDPYLLDWFRKHGYTVEEPETTENPENTGNTENVDEPKGAGKKAPSRKAGE